MKLAKLVRVVLSLTFTVVLCKGVSQAAVVTGICGSANGVPSSTQPSANLCYSGTSSAVTEIAAVNSWSWMCYGSGGGSNSSCQAPVSGGGTTGQAWNSGANCPPGYYDMVGWMTPSPYNNTYQYGTTAHPQYMAVITVRNASPANTGTIYNCHDPYCDFWDISTYTNNYIYSYRTGGGEDTYTRSLDLDWVEGYRFRSWTSDSPGNPDYTEMPWMPRCVNGQGLSTSNPGLLNAIYVPYQLPKIAYTVPLGHNKNPGQCQVNVVASSNTLNLVLGPYNLQFGAETSPQPTLIFAFGYNCNAFFQNCLNVERQFYQAGKGFVYWQWYQLVGGTYQLMQWTEFASQYSGRVSGYVGPCF